MPPKVCFLVSGPDGTLLIQDDPPELPAFEVVNPLGFTKAIYELAKDTGLYLYDLRFFREEDDTRYFILQSKGTINGTRYRWSLPGTEELGSPPQTELARHCRRMRSPVFMEEIPKCEAARSGYLRALSGEAYYNQEESLAEQSSYYEGYKLGRTFYLQSQIEGSHLIPNE